MTRRIILVTGGQRSGKSGYAQRLALELSDCPVYMATSRVWDEEYRKRIERHQRDRGPQWTNIEEEKALSKHHLQGRVIVIHRRESRRGGADGLGNRSKGKRLKAIKLKAGR